MRRALAAAALALLAAAAPARADGPTVTIGSKRFTESTVLGEIAKRLLTDAGFRVEHRAGMGGTIIVWGALTTGGIDLYPEYTGTIAQEILQAPARLTSDEIRARLAARGIGMTAPLGFNNTYALVVRRQQAETLRLRSIADLRQHPRLRVGLTHEFLERRDGWRPLAARYGLEMLDVRGLEHALAYPALASGAIDVCDAYSTDARLASDDLVTLEDSLGFFPRYDAVFLYRLDLPPRAVALLSSMEGKIPERRMIALNAAAERTRNYAFASSLYFGDRPDDDAAFTIRQTSARIGRWTVRHLELVGVSLLLAIAAGIPLGIRASRPGLASQLILGTSSVVFTIPSLALLALLVPVPFLGISARTVVFALFLYSLLPIVRNTAAGLQAIPPALRESAAALGLTPAAQLFRVHLPLASRTILAGVKTAAIVNVATATLAALIGAGGLGEPIFSGLSLNDHRTILEGAVPAALLALGVQGLFGALDRVLIPKGLRLRG